ncbi:MAG: hypothetical protein JJU11_00835, partial [Candidatus Sumerlaeia bacterium]|nr:hypothetical protein [Candidatus Sumerlaeia bacterium]
MYFRGVALVCLVSALAPVHGWNELPVHVYFDEESEHPLIEIRQMDIAVEGGQFKAEITGSDPSFQIPVMAEEPVMVTMRMRSGEGTYDRMEIFWRTPSDRNFSHDRTAMFPLEHDMEWREYQFPLPVVEGPVILRFDPGWKPGLMEIDWIRIEANPLPDELKSGMEALPESVAIENEFLSVTLTPRSAKFDILDRRTDRRWRLDPEKLQSRIVGVNKTGDDSVELMLVDLGDHTIYQSNVSLREGSLHFTLSSENSEALFWGLRHWPPTIKSDFNDGRIVFVDRSSGTLIDQHDPYYAGRDLTIYGNTQGADMPIVALFDWESGDGVLLLAETPTDGHFVLGDRSADLIWPRIRWRQSLDTFRYTREFSYRFSPSGKYVGLAELYRDYAEEVGRRKTLREKAEKTPHLDNLMGGALIWGSTDVEDFIAEARTRGILRAGLGNASHGLRDRTNGLPRL